jgi:hypothetical protein
MHILVILNAKFINCIEKFIHSRKRVDGTRLNQPPAEYTNGTDQK